jgi:NADPH-dependent ferric siderophore reductase
MAVRQLTPRMRRIELTGADLGDFKPNAGQELIVLIPASANETLRRHYTIRRYDAESRLIDIDVFLHGMSPGNRWAHGVRVGDRVEVNGPRGRIRADETADWHLFGGDETSIPAIASICKSLRAADQAYAFIQIGDPSEIQPIDSPAHLQVQWIMRNTANGLSNADSHASGELRESIAKFSLPPGRGHAYLTGETQTARAVRNDLFARGLDRSQVSAEGYWRLGRIGSHDHIDD